MSAGPFLKSKYETDQGNVVKVSIQPETLTLSIDGTANTAPTGAETGGFPSAKVGGGRNSIGINTRLARFKFTGTPPTGYKQDGVLTLPVLQLATYNAWIGKTTGVYDPGGGEVAVELIGLTAEKIR